MPPTIRDVAAAAGVSPTTVSHALNGKGRVDAATRTRISGVADELGYRPNRIARGLRSGRTGTIGLALPETAGSEAGAEMIGLDFYLQLAAGATRAAFARDQALLLLPPLRDAGDVQRLALDGAILNDPVTNDPRITALEAADVPVVTIDRDLGRPERTAWVGNDTQANTLTVLDQLATAGARRIALLTIDAPWSWLADTEAAYREWCAARGADVRIATVPLELAGPAAEQATAKLLDDPDPPDAIYTPPERYAVAVARVAERRGLNVGTDLLLAAGVDSYEARTHDPPITALDLQPQRQGAAAVEHLTAILEGIAPHEPRLIAAQLRIRASSLRAEP